MVKGVQIHGKPTHPQLLEHHDLIHSFQLAFKGPNPKSSQSQLSLFLLLCTEHLTRRVSLYVDITSPAPSSKEVSFSI